MFIRIDKIADLTLCVCTYTLPIMNRSLSYDECNCFALRQAARHVTQIYERHLGQVGLTAAQFTILAKLARKPNLPIADLADSMVMERTTLVRAMKPLQRDGLVVSESAEHDGRTFLFSLTEQGEATFDLAADAWRAAQDEFEEKFGRERARALRSELFDITE
jgi:DNA-binding MarR family transcriptional regulator